MNESESNTVTVLGGTGFVGRAIALALEQRGWNVRIIHAPRLTFTGNISQSELPNGAFTSAAQVLSQQLKGSAAVINAAGDPNASFSDLEALMGPNAALPVVVKRAAELAKVERFVHVSSSVVQGDCEILDSSHDLRPFSPYSQSKVSGEKWLQAEPQSQMTTVIYRPPSVHAVGRGVTDKIRSLASSPFSSVAGMGSSQTPQALLGNVGDAVAFLATTIDCPPLVVHHPWEGLSSADLLRYLGNREPHHLPRWLARSLINTVKSAERPLRFIAPNRRRLELLWFGQGVAPSWLEKQGWVPPLNRGKWSELGKQASHR